MVLTGALWQKYLWLLFPFFGLNTDSQWCQGWTTGANRCSSCLYWTIREGTGNFWQLHGGVVEDPRLTPHTWNHIKEWHWESTSTREQKGGEGSHHWNVFTSSEPQFKPGRPRGPSPTSYCLYLLVHHPQVGANGVKEGGFYHLKSWSLWAQGWQCKVAGGGERKRAQRQSPFARAPDQRCCFLELTHGAAGAGRPGAKAAAFGPLNSHADGSIFSAEVRTAHLGN